MDLDPVTLSELASQVHRSNNERDLPQRGIFVHEASKALLEASVRLVRLLNDPDDAKVLGPSVIREILYLLLKGPDGLAILQFTRSGSKVHKISQAVHTLMAGYQEQIAVEALAQVANMSRSAFFKEFKQVTAMSPIQYLKRLRLLEARRLMSEDSVTAELAALGLDTGALLNLAASIPECSEIHLYEIPLSTKLGSCKPESDRETPNGKMAV